MTISKRLLAPIGLAVLISAFLIGALIASYKPNGSAAYIAIGIVAFAISSGLQSLSKALQSGTSSTPIIGILAPAAAWACAGLIACWAPWPILTALLPILGPPSIPLAVLTALCGTAGAICTGRWIDLSIAICQPNIERESAQP